METLLSYFRFKINKFWQYYFIATSFIGIVAVLSRPYSSFVEFIGVILIAFLLSQKNLWVAPAFKKTDADYKLTMKNILKPRITMFSKTKRYLWIVVYYAANCFFWAIYLNYIFGDEK